LAGVRKVIVNVKKTARINSSEGVQQDTLITRSQQVMGTLYWLYTVKQYLIPKPYKNVRQGYNRNRRPDMLTIVTSIVTFLGALVYGVVIGWAAHYMRTRDNLNGVGDIAMAVTLVGGGVVVALLGTHGGAFGAFSFGLAVGFFAPALAGKLQHRGFTVTPAVLSPAPAATPTAASPIPEPPESPIVIEEENPSSEEII
jgi:hypothetical protein